MWDTCEHFFWGHFSFLKFCRSKFKSLVLVLKSKSLKVFKRQGAVWKCERDGRPSVTDTQSSLHHAEAGFLITGLQITPLSLPFLAHTSMFRNLPLPTGSSFVSLQHSYAGRTYSSKWQPAAHSTVQTHNKEAVLAWPDPKAQFTPGTGWYCRSHCHKTKEGKRETVMAWEKKVTDKSRIKRGR